MAQKFQTLKDEEIVRSLKGTVTESAAATYTETAIDTQLSIERGVIWLIHGIQFFPSELMATVSSIAANGEEFFHMHVSRESKSAICVPNDADLIQRCDYDIVRSAAIGTDAGPLWVTSYMVPRVFAYNPPLPYASQTIYLGLIGSSGAVETAYFQILYTIRSVSDKYFFRVAQALLG
jgi:hypothetical protein